MDDEDLPASCVEHMWRVVAVTFADGSFSEYECELCGSQLLVPPGGVHPDTF